MHFHKGNFLFLNTYYRAQDGPQQGARYKKYFILKKKKEKKTKKKTHYYKNSTTF